MTNSLLCCSVTLLMFIQTLHSSQPASRIGDFGNFFSRFAKSPRVFRSSWILNEGNFYFKIVKYYILSEVCMIKTAPHSNVAPLMWCITSIKRLVYTPPDLLARFCKANLSNAKIRPDLFSTNLFSRFNLLWSRAILALKCDRRLLLFFGCTLLDCLQIIFL